MVSPMLRTVQKIVKISTPTFQFWKYRMLAAISNQNGANISASPQTNIPSGHRSGVSVKAPEHLQLRMLISHVIALTIARSTNT